MLLSFLPSGSRARTLCCALILFASFATSSVLVRDSDKQSLRDPNEFDYIIVGGGLTGLVAAHRLSENLFGSLSSFLLPVTFFLQLKCVRMRNNASCQHDMM